MSLRPSLRAVLTPSAFLPSLGAIATGVILMAMQTTSAQAAGQYYNCANADGCQLVSSRYLTSDHTKTKYPVVLAHGMAGFTKMFGLVDYFYGIPETLMSGGSQVYTTKTSSFNNSEVRGEQLLQKIKTISAISGSPKVNLLGHSQGGIDIRYVAGVAPEYVASVTAIASPEQGSKTADAVRQTLSEGSLATQAVSVFLQLFGGITDVGSGTSPTELNKQEAWNTAVALSTEGAAKFNAKFPAAMPTRYCGQPTGTEANGIKYYSFSGVGQITNGLDPSDYMLVLTGTSFDNDPNDGLVSACSSRLGYVIRDDYRMNHLDSANQLLGLTAWGQPDPKTLYRDQVNRLKKANL